jgi:hypothetical protein
MLSTLRDPGGNDRRALVMNRESPNRVSSSWLNARRRRLGSPFAAALLFCERRGSVAALP